MPRVMAYMINAVMFVSMCLDLNILDQNCLRISMLFITRVKMMLVLGRKFVQ